MTHPRAPSHRRRPGALVPLGESLEDRWLPSLGAGPAGLLPLTAPSLGGTHAPEPQVATAPAEPPRAVDFGAPTPSSGAVGNLPQPLAIIVSPPGPMAPVITAVVPTTIAHPTTILAASPALPPAATRPAVDLREIAPLPIPALPSAPPAAEPVLIGPAVVAVVTTPVAGTASIRLDTRSGGAVDGAAILRSLSPTLLSPSPIVAALILPVANAVSTRIDVTTSRVLTEIPPPSVTPSPNPSPPGALPAAGASLTDTVTNAVITLIDVTTSPVPPPSPAPTPVVLPFPSVPLPSVPPIDAGPTAPASRPDPTGPITLPEHPPSPSSLPTSPPMSPASTPRPDPAGPSDSPAAPPPGSSVPINPPSMPTSGPMAPLDPPAAPPNEPTETGTDLAGTLPTSEDGSTAGPPSPSSPPVGTVSLPPRDGPAPGIPADPAAPGSVPRWSPPPAPVTTPGATSGPAASNPPVGPAIPGPSSIGAATEPIADVPAADALTGRTSGVSSQAEATTGPSPSRAATESDPDVPSAGTPSDRASGLLAVEDEVWEAAAARRSLGELVPQLAGLLARTLGLDPAPIEQSIEQLLAEGEELGADLARLLTRIDLACWLMAVLVSAAAYEIARRELRRTRPELDPTAGYRPALDFEA
jgi:hypothetical protein